MNQISEIQASKFACFSHLTPEVRNEQIQSLFYIERMAGVSNTDISKIDIFDVFGSKTADKALLVTSKGEINKRLLAVSSLPKTAPSKDMNEAQIASIQAMNDAYMQKQTERLESLKRDKRNILENAANYAERMNSYMRNAWNIEIQIQKITGSSPDFGAEFEKITKTGFWAFHEIKGTDVIFITQAPIVLTYKNQAAGIDYQVPMGRYKACYNAKHNHVRVEKFERNPIAGSGYYHPYISAASGDICFGNAAAQAQRLMATLDLAGYFELLSALLTTYSPDSNPYTSLESFKYAAEKGYFDTRPICVRCGADEGDCGCEYCPKCNGTYESTCDEHWCNNCETYERNNCDCCQECGTQNSSENSSHDEDCSYFERPQTANQEMDF